MNAFASPPWPEVRIGELLTHVDEHLILDDAAEYVTITVKRRHGGLEERERLLGHQIQTKKQSRLIPGAFIISRVQCWHQAYAIVPNEIPPNMIASINYDQFSISHKVDRRFFWWLSHSPHFTETVRSSAFGVVVEKMVFNRRAWLEKKIPLPSLEEQLRIVERVEELAARIRGALALRQTAAEEASALVSSAIAALLDHAGWDTQPLGQLLTESPRNGLSPRPEVESDGRPMLRINAVSSSPTRFVDLTAFKRVEVADDEAEPFVLRNDDVFIVRYNGDINRVAKPAIYKGKDKCRIVFPDKLMRLRPDQSKILPDFLVFALSSRSVRDQIETLGKTTAGNIGISGNNAKSFVIQVPPIPEQRRIVAHLDDLQENTDSLRSLQAKTSAELDGLMPSILDKAFRGEL